MNHSDIQQDSTARVTTAGKSHPRRPAKPQGEVYRRFIPELNMHFSMQTVTIEKHVELFTRWMNQPRVDKFWKESGDIAKQTEYLQKQLADPHSLPLIGYFDDQPFAYFEVYWAKEDHISPFYACGDYDRGIHMLVGEQNHRGPHKVKAWLSSLVHYLLSDDSRTDIVVSEPRADNDKMIHYLEQIGFVKTKEFDFPHKRAALMQLQCSAFFDLFNLN